ALFRRAPQPAAAAHGTAARRRLAPPDDGDREDAGCPALHRRDTRPEPARAAVARPAAGAAVLEARPGDRGLPAAHELDVQRREPRHRDLRDLAQPEGAREGTQLPRDRALAAQP